MRSQNFAFRMMNKAELKILHRKLKEIVEELESAIYSDTDSYTLNIDYEDVLTYYSDRPNAEEGL